ncbi:GPW/gp25 family protein [Fluviicola sp.]|uniref:GPW/gp25 family protein n=1 Tax=Fluviicola sp. TaxID=1917219 RepID=UPI00261F30D0|nr:GPW/gp25 family protein [Fluviicola sp.]
MEINESFLGTGWSFPPSFDKTSRFVRMSSDEKDIMESLQVLLSTRPGERIMLPGYGCSLETLLFESINLTLTTQITEIIRTSILYYEPRIDLENVTLDEQYILDGRIDITLDYRIRTTNSRQNMVYPFYRNEGNDISYTKTGII